MTGLSPSLLQSDTKTPGNRHRIRIRPEKYSLSISWHLLCDKHGLPLRWSSVSDVLCAFVSWGVWWWSWCLWLWSRGSPGPSAVRLYPWRRGAVPTAWKATGSCWQLGSSCRLSRFRGSGPPGRWCQFYLKEEEGSGWGLKRWNGGSMLGNLQKEHQYLKVRTLREATACFIL